MAKKSKTREKQGRKFVTSCKITLYQDSKHFCACRSCRFFEICVERGMDYVKEQTMLMFGLSCLMVEGGYFA